MNPAPEIRLELDALVFRAVRTAARVTGEIWRRDERLAEIGILVNETSGGLAWLASTSGATGFKEASREGKPWRLHRAGFSTALKAAA